jgi:hypothetical protein
MFTLLNRTPVLWFLFLFNAAVAVAAAVGGSHLHAHGHTLHGSQQVITAAGMGVVALGAGAALLVRRAKRPGRHPAVSRPAAPASPLPASKRVPR